MYSTTGLRVSNINAKGVTRVCGFDAQALPGCLAIATDTGFIWGGRSNTKSPHYFSADGRADTTHCTSRPHSIRFDDDGEPCVR